MNRREIREHTFKELFLMTFYKEEEYQEQCQRYLEDTAEVEESYRTMLSSRAQAVSAIIPDLDAQINDVSEGWKTNRMGKVELTILRLALYEMSVDEDIPVRVAINEAVELAKLYGGDDSPAFVNAILGKLARRLEA